MNIFGTNFLIGFLIANDRPRNEAFTIALTASLFPANNFVGPLLLKTLVDKVNDLENQVRRPTSPPTGTELAGSTKLKPSIPKGVESPSTESAKQEKK